MIIVRPREYSPSERWYLWELCKSMLVTLRHLVRNAWCALAHKRNGGAQAYPEEPAVFPQRARLLHRMNRKPDGTPKCVACFMCVMACPSDAIAIVAEESSGEVVSEATPTLSLDTTRTLKSFAIDQLRCMQCGLCVEACPKDALRTDSDVGHLVGLQRSEFIYELDALLEQPPRAGAYLGDREADAKARAETEEVITH